MSARVSPTPVDRWAEGWATRATTVAAVLMVAAVAAIISFSHMQTLAARAGEGWRAWLLPLSVDGLVISGSMVLLTRRRAGLPGGRLAWCALLGGVAASLAANIAAADDNVTARLVASWPAAAFAVAFELLLQQRRVPVPAPAGDPVGGDSPAADPVVDQPVEVDEAAVEPAVEVDEVDPVAARIAELVGAEGRPVGRRTVARELGITEYRAGQMLARTDNGDGRHTR